MTKQRASEDKITPEIFEHLVQLAALDLSDEERDYLRKELNAQLGAIRELEAIEVDPSIDITSHGVPYQPGTTPGLREDVNISCPEADDIVAGAPTSEDRYLIVPDIPHEVLE